MKKNILLSLLLATLSLAGCRKDSPEIIHPSENSYVIYSENYWSNVFNDYWSAMSQSYLFWKYDTLDWDAIYDTYAPQFAELDSICTNDPDQYFELSDIQGTDMYSGDITACQLFKEVAVGLLDHHYVLLLYFPYEHLEYVAIKGSATVDIPSRDYYHEYNGVGLFGGLKVTVDYEKSTGRITEYKGGEYKSDYETVNLNMMSYLIDGSVPYLYLSGFYISSGIYDGTEDEYETPLDPSDDTKSEVLDNFERLVRETPNMKGAIIDVRGNGGGYNNDLNLILGRFINKNEKLPFANTQHKSGPNRYDYTETTTCYISGTSEEPTYLFPIVMVADLYSVSMSEITTIASRAFSDKSIMVGERTYGGTCSLCSDIYLAGGIVDTDNFYIYTCACLLYDLDMNFYEGVGITPDIEVLFEESTWGTTTTDEQKSVAVEYIKGL